MGSEDDKKPPTEPPTLKEALGSALARVRKARALQQRGVWFSPATLSAIECGQKIPSLDTLFDFAKALQIPAWVILFFTNDATQQAVIPNGWNEQCVEELNHLVCLVRSRLDALLAHGPPPAPVDNMQRPQKQVL